jgi:hypothetical protein
MATDPASAVPTSEEAGIVPPEVLLTRAADRRAADDPLECPDYVKAACGLALGLGMTSGPLFSDLVAMPRRRVSTWVVDLGTRAWRAVPDAPDAFRVRKISSWLRGLIVRG